MFLQFAHIPGPCLHVSRFEAVGSVNPTLIILLAHYALPELGFSRRIFYCFVFFGVPRRGSSFDRPGCGVRVPFSVLVHAPKLSKDPMEYKRHPGNY